MCFGKLGTASSDTARPTLFSPVSRENFFCIEYGTVGFGGRDNADPIKSDLLRSTTIDHDRHD